MVYGGDLAGFCQSFIKVNLKSGIATYKKKKKCSRIRNALMHSFDSSALELSSELRVGEGYPKENLGHLYVIGGGTHSTDG